MRGIRKKFNIRLEPKAIISEIKKWGVDPNAKKSEFKLREDAPENIKRLYSLYEEASSKDPYNPNDINSYHSKDFFEFVAGMYSSPEYRARVEEKNKGFIAKFLDTIRSIFSKINYTLIFIFHISFPNIS